MCAKCSGNHATDSCIVTEESYKCANCCKVEGADDNHRADSALCPAYIAAVNLEQAATKNSKQTQSSDS